MARFSSLVLVLVLALSLSAPACGGKRYVYAPVTTTGAEIVGHPAAEVAFPPDAPRGQVSLATFGLVKLTDDAARSVHLRMVITNRSAEPWVIDQSEQKLELTAGGGPATLLASATGGAPPRVEIAPGETTSLDLFFLLPHGAREASEVPAFDATWTVHVGPRAITTSTAFERFLTPPPAAAPGRSAPRGGGAGGRQPLDRANERLPGTPDSRWPAPQAVPVPDPMPVPGPP